MTNQAGPAASTRRRPLPALICLAALTLLTALVWWRVLSRHDGTPTAAAGTTCHPAAAPSLLPQPKGVTLTVYNATQRAGLAKTTAAALSKDGFAVAGYTNDPGNLPVAGVAEIRYAPDQKPAATLLLYYFPGAKLVPLDGTADPRLAVAVGAKFTAVAAPAAVQSALSTAHLSQAPSGAPVPAATSAGC